MNLTELACLLVSLNHRLWPQLLFHRQGAKRPGPTHLGPIVTEDPYNADRNCFIQTPPQCLAVECKHKGDVLLTGTVDDGVQCVVQSTWSKTDSPLSITVRSTAHTKFHQEESIL